MNRYAEMKSARPGTQLRKGIHALLLGAVLTVLAACSSGDGGTDVTIGSGQSSGSGAGGSTGGDPVTQDFPVFYVKRPVPDPTDEDAPVNDARELIRFEFGADLYMRAAASPSSPEINLTGAETNGRGDIRDVDVNFDGSKVVFAMRTPFVANVDIEDQLASWNIWEYDAKTRVLRRLIASNTIENEGHDIMPHYLPDGRIVFSSTRQRTSRAILLDENKPQYAAQVEGDDQPAFNLHVMDATGTNIKQISFNQSHDLDPAVLNDGRIVFTRWERAIDDSQMDLYTINPDGGDLKLLYGSLSHSTGTPDATTNVPTTIQFLNPRPMADNKTLAIVRPFTGTNEGGDLVLIDTTNYVECNQTVPTTGAPTPASPVACDAQTRALPTKVITIPGPSPGGRYRSAAPLFDGTNRLLVSWSQCRLLEGTRIVPCTNDRLDEPDAVEAPPLYGIYIYDVRDNTQKPIVTPQEGFIYTEVVAGSGRTLPPVLLDRVAGVDFPQALDQENVGILNIRSVYDFDGTDNAPGGIANVRNPATAAYANRTARYLLIEKVVSQPDEDTRDVPNFAFGPNGRRFGMRDILGYAPIEPDGSVKVKVPANVAFAISVLDRNGRRFGARHTNWLQLTPGETVQCNGCHTDTATGSRRAHGRSGLFTSANTGAPASGAPFPNTNAALIANAGETMAETRGRLLCGGACKPSVNIVDIDYWAAAAATPTFEACYLKVQTDIVNRGATPTYLCADEGLKITPLSPLPTSDSCVRNWTSRCRVTIHYEQNIHPLWSATRVIDQNNDGVPDEEAAGLVYDQCNDCHNSVDLAGVAKVPDGDLDLSDGPSEEDADQKRAYRELLFADRGQIVDDTGVVIDECIATEIDPVTNVEVCVAFRNVPAPLSVGNPPSSRFFRTFDAAGPTVDHRTFMTRAELKLVAEWLNVGAQYYNDPFVAPEN